MNKKLLISGAVLILLLAGCNNAPTINNNAPAAGNSVAAETQAARTEENMTAESALTETAEVDDETPAADEAPAAEVPNKVRVQRVAAPETGTAESEVSEPEVSEPEISQEETVVTEEAGGLYAPLAKCLTQKGVRMYGAYWCPHCAEQKEMFGDDFRFVKYFECDPQGENSQAARCTQDKITSYPTWYFPVSGYDPGTKPLEEVAKLADCESYLPRPN